MVAFSLSVKWALCRLHQSHLVVPTQPASTEVQDEILKKKVDARGQSLNNSASCFTALMFTHSGNR